MGTQRQSSSSEIILNGIFQKIRNIDKMLWSQNSFYQEIIEETSSIKNDFDMMIHMYENEINIKDNKR